MSNPPGYDAILDVGTQLPDRIPVAETRSEEVLRTFITAHQQLLDDLRRSLDGTHTVPQTPFKRDSASEADAIRRLETAFRAEQELAKLGGRLGDLAQSYVDMIRAAQLVASGGTVFDWLFGSVLEREGVSGLRDIAPQLTPLERRRLVRTLEAIQEKRKPWEEIVASDCVVGTQPFVWRGILAPAILKVTGHEPLGLRNAHRLYCRRRLEMTSLIHELWEKPLGSECR